MAEMDKGFAFGISDNVLKDALRKGIKINVKGEWVTPPGKPSLAWHEGFKRFVIVFGTDSSNAGFVLTEDHYETWRIA